MYCTLTISVYMHGPEHAKKQANWAHELFFFPATDHKIIVLCYPGYFLASEFSKLLAKATDELLVFC